MAEYLGYQDEAVDIAARLARSPAVPAKTAMQTAGILIRGQQPKTANNLLDKLPYSFDPNVIGTNQFDPPGNLAEFIANSITDAALAYSDPQFISMVPARLQLALSLDPTNDSARFFLAQSWFELEHYDRARSCLLYTSPSPRDQRGSRMPSSA